MVRRWLALLGAAFVGALAITVGVAAGPVPYAAAWTVPSPVTNPFQTVTSTGTRGGLCTSAAATGCVLVAGVGAFQGTCWLLGVIYDDSDGCSSGGKTIINWITGNDGDSRVTYTGPAGVIGVDGYAGAVGTFGVRFFHGTYGDDRFKVEYASPGGGTCSITATPGPGGTTKVFDLAQSPSVDANVVKTALGLTSVSTSACTTSGTPWVTRMWYYRQTTPIETLAEWNADPGLGSPWNLNYSQNCRNAAGQSVTITGATTFTPVPGATSSGLEMDACSTVLPGGYLNSLDIGGGRAGITSPTPDVAVSVGTPQSVKDDYPLCTTGAPADGCFLDLQRDGKSCFSAGVYCAGWMTNTTRWNMSCEWGPYALAMSVCEGKYGTKFDTQPQPQPSTSPTVTPAPPIQPLPTEGPNPTVPPTRPDVETDPDSANCWGQGWSWNPVSWVYVPVKCALSWAFIPNEWPDFGSLSSPLPPGWIPSLPNISGGACGPITIGSLDFVLARSNPQTLVNTCDDPWPTVRNVTYYGVLTLGLMTLGQRAFRATLVALGMAVEYGAATAPDGGKP